MQRKKRTGGGDPRLEHLSDIATSTKQIEAADIKDTTAIEVEPADLEQHAQPVMSPVLAAARSYAARGLGVIPLRGKVPAIASEDGGHGVHDATTDDAQLVEWFTNKYRNIGIAIPHGIIVLDVDVQHDGDKTLKRWCDEHGWEWLAGVPRQRTGNGGWHYWFRHDGPLPRVTMPEYPGIELRHHGHYVVGAPSIHPNGNAYVWEVELP